MKILFIEDEIVKQNDILKYLNEELSQNEVEVATFFNGQGCLHLENVNLKWMLL